MPLLGAMGGKLLMVVVALALLGGAYIWITTAAYNRGHAAGWADNTAAQKKATAIKKRIATDNRAQLDKLPPEKVDDELEKRCREAGGGDACAQ